jgi:hypothetical protein
VKLWTLKFIGALAVLAVFLWDAWWLGPDPVTGHARHPVLPYADTGAASFVFLLVSLYIFSHVGQWTKSKLWRRPEPVPAEPKKKPRRRGR